MAASPAEPVYFASAAAFRAWLQAHAHQASELLVGFHKVGSGSPSLRWSESVDEALCVGWVDGVRRRIDAQRYCIRFTPRREGSHWSAVNVAKVERLIAAGRLGPAGWAAWSQRRPERTARASYERQDAPDLLEAEWQQVRDVPAAWAFCAGLAPGYRRTHLHWIVSAKRPATRAARLQRCIADWAAGINRFKSA